MHVAQQESRQSGAAARRSLRARSVERQLSRAMLIARHAKIVSLADVGAELYRVAALNSRPVVHELNLFLVLIQRAVAAVDAQRIAELEEVIAVIVDEEGRHAARETVRQVQAGDTGVLGRRGVEAVRHHEHLITEEAEAEVREEVRAQHVIEARRDAVIERTRSSGEGAGAAALVITGAARNAVNSGRTDGEPGETVAPENVQLVGRVPVGTRVEGVVVEFHGARSGVVRLVGAGGRIGRREQLEQIQSRLRDPAGGDDVAGELLAGGGSGSAGGIENRQTKTAQIAGPFGQ